MFYLMRYAWATVLLLTLVHNTPTIEGRNVTNEDIRDAMLQLLHMFRQSEDKLERHEFREKALGEQLKKGLAGLEKKHRALEPLKGTLSRLDERLSSVETILMQKEEKEKQVQQKTNEALEAIQNTLQILTANLPKLVKAQASSDSNGDINLTTNTDSVALNFAFGPKIDAALTTLNIIKEDIANVKNSFKKDALRAACLEMALDNGPLGRHISETEKLLTKYELKLSEYNTSGKLQPDIVPLSEVSMSDEAWHSKMTEVMERQENEIKKINKALINSEGIWKEMPNKQDLNFVTNNTMEAVQKLEYNVLSNSEKESQKIVKKLTDMNEQSLATQQDVQKSLTDGNVLTEKLYRDVSKSYEQLRTEMQGISSLEKVLIQTADNVLDTKKRIEYGVQQILIEVSELVKQQGKTINKTISNRFNDIETSIVDKQTGGLTNLSSKIEEEMSHVWRQIGIVYRRMTASKTSLDKLQQQTEQYVNGSAATMDGMESKVGQITSRITQVDENLNYLLGRLSLVTQEFNQIKTGLGDALDNIKSSFQTVQDKLKSKGPGPHPIDSDTATPS